MKRLICDITSLGYIEHHFDFYKLIVALLLNARKLLQHATIDRVA